MSESKNKNKITIVTHSLKFHADDVLAVATLLLILEKENDVTVIRTRDPEIISRADYVVDVGGIDDPEKITLTIIRKAEQGEEVTEFCILHLD